MVDVIKITLIWCIVNILKRKLEPKSQAQDLVNNSSEVWQILNQTVSEAFTELVDSTWEIDKIETMSGEWKELRTGLSAEGLFYGMGDTEDKCSVFVAFDSDFGALIADQSLKPQETEEGTVYTPSMLDLILFRPVAQKIEVELRNLLAASLPASGNPFSFTNNGTNPSDIGMIKGEADWSKILFSIREAEDDMFEAVNVNDAAAEKKEETPRRALRFQIILPLNLTPRPLPKSVNDTPVLDLDNPWTQHMRRSLDGALVPVRAVVETCRMTVADCTRLETGQIIDLPGVSLQSVGVEAEMKTDRVKFSVGALGVYKSHRAIKLTEDIIPGFSQNIDLCVI